MLYLAADTGGTFTDVVAFDRASGDLRFGKALTTYGNLVDGVMIGVRDMGVPMDKVGVLKHGTTHVINAIVQRRGAKAALVTSAGFQDVLELARANRPIGFDLEYRRHDHLVERMFSFEVGGRIDRMGKEISPLDQKDLDHVISELRSRSVEAVAVSLINSFVNPQHEQSVAAQLREAMPNVFVTTGTELVREMGEFERTSTAVANAYVGPRAHEYLNLFSQTISREGFTKTFYMMASNGGVLPLERAMSQPIALLESGPVGGCIGAGIYADALGLPRVIAFDMGGTTAKCALVEDGKYDVQPTYYVGGYDYGFPVRTPILDIVEVGAGGGSIASVDEQGRLQVGPRSAGSEPGPVAFGRGGTEPTVTDANLVLGRIGAGTFMGGALNMDIAAAREAILSKVARPLGFSEGDLDRVASGILRMAMVTMGDAIKEISVERGLDTREFDLFVFGGGGPLHGASLARELHIPRVVVPPHPGNFSAVGMLLAEYRIDESRTFLSMIDNDAVFQIRSAFDQLEAEVRPALSAENGAGRILFDRALELRYRGQAHSVRVDIGHAADASEIRVRFHSAYRARYGHGEENTPVECVALKLTGYNVGDSFELGGLYEYDSGGAPPKPSYRSVYYHTTDQRIETPVYLRSKLAPGFKSDGPAIIEDYGSTIVIEPGDRFAVGLLGEITIHCE
jgi:N-methylhydantoinase A